MLLVGDAEKFLQVFGFEPGSFFSVSKRGPCFTAEEEDGGDMQTAGLLYPCTEIEGGMGWGEGGVNEPNTTTKATFLSG